MIRPWHSLYARIAGVYLVVLLLLAAGTAWLVLHEFARFNREIEQRVDRPRASNLAMTLAPALRDGPNSEAARTTVQHIAAINPALSLYLLDDQGRVLAAYNAPGCPDPTPVPLAPLKQFLADDAIFPILGPSPCDRGRNIFSATPLQYSGGRSGYLYVLLHGRPYRSAAGMLRQSYIARTLLVTVGLAMALAVTIGLVWFALLTRRFRALTTAVRRFSAGEYSGRVPAPGRDEIGHIGHAFNEMAATIEAQVTALQRTDEMRRDLVANISHDFRTPLTALRGYADRLAAKGEALPADERERCLQAIVKSTAQLERLAQQLFTLSHLDARGSALHLEPFAMTELVQDIVVKFQPEAQRLGIDLRCAPGSSAPLVQADIGLVERALSNLIDNALRNTPAGGEVRVALAPSGGALRIRVADTGRGIPSEELALVTQRFYRVRGGRSANADGSGLGLSITREIVERHGTTLHLESRPDAGTTAWFDLPLAGSDAR